MEDFFLVHVSFDEGLFEPSHVDLSTIILADLHCHCVL